MLGMRSRDYLGDVISAAWRSCVADDNEPRFSRRGGIPEQIKLLGAHVQSLRRIEAVKQRLSSLETERYSLSPEEEIRIRSMGDHFAGVWQSNHCPPALKKMIFRTAIEEIIVGTDQDKKHLELVIHWKGGAHTQLAMERPRSVTETATPMEALEIIRRMAVRYGDDQIASVLNRRGYSTGKGKRWNQTRVATARRKPP